MSASNPNILFLLTDQQRYDTIGGLNNSVIRTPNLRRLTASGTTFHRAMVPVAECVPSRCCFTHGQYPTQTGCCNNGSHFPTEDGKSWRPWPKTEFPANPQACKLFQDHPWATDIQTPPEYSR